MKFESPHNAGNLSRLLHSVGGADAVKRLAGPGIASFFIKTLGAFLGYAMMVLLARMMDAANYGLFGVMLNASVVGNTIVAFGLPTLIMRLWPENLVKGKSGSARAAALHGFNIILFVSIIAMVVAAAMDWTGIGTAQLGIKGGAMAIALLSAGGAFADYLSSLLRAQNFTIWSLAPRDIVWRVATPLSCGLLLYFNKNLTAIEAMLVTSAVMFVTMIPQFWKSLHIVRQITRGVKSTSEWRQWRKILMPIWGASILYAMIQQLDVVVVGTMVGSNEAGAYFAAQKTASLLSLTMIAGGLIGAPLMAGAYHGGKIDELRRLLRFLSLAIGASTILGVLILSIIGPHLLALFDEEYRTAYTVLMILSVGFAIDAMAGPSAYLMQMTGLEKPCLVIMAIAYAIVLTLQFIFVPTYGMIAAALSNTAGSMFWSISAVMLLRHYRGVDPSVLSFFKKKQTQ